MKSHPLFNAQVTHRNTGGVWGCSYAHRFDLFVSPPRTQFFFACVHLGFVDTPQDTFGGGKLGQDNHSNGTACPFLDPFFSPCPALPQPASPRHTPLALVSRPAVETDLVPGRIAAVVPEEVVTGPAEQVARGPIVVLVAAHSQPALQQGAVPMMP